MNESTITKIKDTTVSNKPQSVYVEILFLLSNKRKTKKMNLLFLNVHHTSQIYDKIYEVFISTGSYYDYCVDIIEVLDYYTVYNVDRIIILNDIEK